MQRCVLGCVLLAGLATAGGCGAAKVAEPAENLSAEAAEFQRLFGQWKTLIDELRRLDLDYRDASTSRRPEMKTRYDELVQEGTRLQGQLIQAAMLAYVKAPEKNRPLAGFLVGIVYLLGTNEEYEETLEIAQLLIENGVRTLDLYSWAAVSAFVVGQFDVAEKYFELMKDKGGLSELGQQLYGDIPYYKEAWEKEKQIRFKESMAGDLPRVLLKTNQGEIELELLENEAPNTVANFIFLVENGFYDGLTFHRVIPQLMAQSGCPKGDGSGGPGYSIRCECYKPEHRLHFRGSLSMANSGPDTGGSQFFLTFTPQRQLDGRHTVFGRVVRGIEVLSRLQRRDPPPPESRMINPHQNIVIPPADTILEATVLRKRNHPYRPMIRPDPFTTPPYPKRPSPEE